MTQSTDCEISAQAWADHLAETNTFKHASRSDKNGQGENLYVAYTSDVYESAYDQEQYALKEAARAVQSWYAEIEDYNWRNPDGSNAEEVGYFTQVVWDTSLGLGVGWKVYRADGWTKVVIVARYSPSGNNVGQNKFHVNTLKSCDDIPAEVQEATTKAITEVATETATEAITREIQSKHNKVEREFHLKCELFEEPS